MATIRTVFDASVLLRALLAESEAARTWLRRVETFDARAHVPELVYAELAHALLRAVRARKLSAEDAKGFLDSVLALPMRVHSHRRLAAAALVVALERGTSVYDAMYLVLADAADAVLVTADRRLAEVYDRLELLT